MNFWSRISAVVLSLVLVILLLWRHWVKSEPYADLILIQTPRGQQSVRYEHNPKYAYVCLCANIRAIYPTLVLFSQLKRAKAQRGQYVALVSSEIPTEYREVLELFGIKVSLYPARPVFRPAYETTKKSTQDRDRILWQKIRVWNMTEYERVIMLDYDLVILDNFDELFDTETLIAGVPMLHVEEKVVFWEEPQVGDHLESVWHGLVKKTSLPRPGWTGLNSGVLFLRPDTETFSDLIHAASKLTERPCCPTQEFIFRFFEVRGGYTRLSAIYNLRKVHLFPTQEERDHLMQTAKIYHFVERQKPIVLGRSQVINGDNLFGKLWWRHADVVDQALHDAGLPETLVRTIHSEAIKSALT